MADINQLLARCKTLIEEVDPSEASWQTFADIEQDAKSLVARLELTICSLEALKQTKDALL